MNFCCWHALKALLVLVISRAPFKKKLLDRLLIRTLAITRYKKLEIQVIPAANARKPCVRVPQASV